jgi:hypothetical protein
MNSLQIKDAVMTNIEISRYFCGVHASDQIPKMLKPPISMIINLDPAYLKGSHWVSLCIGREGEGVYMDSFGRPPNENFIIQQYCNKWHFNSKQIQPKESLLCGEYCLYFIYWWSRGMRGRDILAKFSPDLYYNDKLVSMFCTSIFPSKDLFIQTL